MICRMHYTELYWAIRKSIDTNETIGCKRQVSVLLAKLDKLAIQQSNHSDRLRIRDADVVEGPVLQRDKFSVLFLQVHAWMYTFYHLHMYIMLYEWCFGHLHTMQKITMFISFLWASRNDSWWSTPELLQTSISHFHESQAVLTVIFEAYTTKMNKGCDGEPTNCSIMMHYVESSFWMILIVSLDQGLTKAC